jgi:hypothetical protein
MHYEDSENHMTIDEEVGQLANLCNELISRCSAFCETEEIDEVQHRAMLVVVGVLAGASGAFGTVQELLEGSNTKDMRITFTVPGDSTVAMSN